VVGVGRPPVSGLCIFASSASRAAGKAETSEGNGVAQVIVQMVESDGLVIELAADRSSLVAADRSSLGGRVELVSDEGRMIGKMAGSLEDAFARLTPAIDRIVAVLRTHGPDGMEVQFGLTVGGETGLIVAKGSAEANFSVTLRWDNTTP
jgi:hypothetical protein